MSILEKVKLRLGITYTDPLKDMELESKIDSCMADMIASGAKFENITSPLAIENMVIYIDSPQASLNPVYISNIVKLRSVL